MPETTTALTTSHFNTETNMPETTTALTSSQITLSNTNITTLISTTPLPMSELYQSIFSFQIDGNVDDTMKQIIRIETARNLNIELRMVGLLQVTSRPSARRLLSFTASFTITAVSIEESKLIEKNLSIDNLNTILSTASGGTITATNLVISRSYDTPKEDTKTAATSGDSLALHVVIVIVGFILSLLAVYGAYSFWKKSNTKPPIPVRDATFDVSYYDYRQIGREKTPRYHF